MFIMAYATDSKGIITQRTQEGWVYITAKHPDVARKWVADRNERLRRVYADNGISVRFPS